MRLDKFLKVSRLIKRRTIANEACDADKVEVNGVVKRASYDVKLGDVITIKLGSKVTTVKVLSLSEHIRKEQAADMYMILEGNEGSESEPRIEENWQYVQD